MQAGPCETTAPQGPPPERRKTATARRILPLRAVFRFGDGGCQAVTCAMAAARMGTVRAFRPAMLMRLSPTM